MTRQELAARVGAKLRRMRVRLGFSIREVERRSHELAKKRQSPDFFLSRGCIADIENDKFIPGVFKMVSLSVLYRLSIERFMLCSAFRRASSPRNGPCHARRKPTCCLPAMHLLWKVLLLCPLPTD
jgi:hypothetical protein